MNILPKLLLNKHPKDSDNLSLINALNVKISNDESCITNEESITENTFISNYLNNFYGANIYKIITIIPCNTELVIIALNTNTPNEADIFRYREVNNTQYEDIKHVYGKVHKLKYNGGKLKGTFTYNVEGSLIIAIVEYDGKKQTPLKTINLGNFDNDDIYNDRNIPDSLLSISPEIKLPKINNLEYVAGSAYKGWYYLFIRFKINSVDYTQWYNIGYPIYIDNIEQFQIVRYCYNRDTHLEAPEDPYTHNSLIYPNKPLDGFGVGCSDYFSNKQDIAKETFKVDINFLNTEFTKYQIGIVCSSKSYIKAFKTSDFIIKENNNKFIFNSKIVDEGSVLEFINDNYNYFNVKNIINYKNRLYISNYLENNLNAKIDKTLIDNIKVKLNKTYITDDGLVYDQCIIKSNNSSNQYDIYNYPRVPLDEYLGVPKNTRISVTISITYAITDDADKFFITTHTADGFNSSYGNLVIGHFREDSHGGYTTEYMYVENFSESKYYIKNLSNPNAQDIELNLLEYALQSGRKYINTKKAFNKRKLYSTLIPGEVYNFFIHFVDKYGHSTNGYRISNNNKYITEDNERIEVIPIKINLNDITVYAAIPINEDLLKQNKLNTECINYYNNLYDNKLIGKINEPNSINKCVTSILNQFESFVDNKFINYKWFQVVNPVGDAFSVYINNNGERLFRVPSDISYKQRFIFDYDFNFIRKTYNEHTIYNPSFENINIPEGYVGYFISYEKYEPLVRATGLLTRNDFRSQDYIKSSKNEIISKLETANCRKSDNMLFYSSVFDISDNLKLDYDIFRIEGVNQFKKDDIPEYDYIQRNSGFNFMHDMNKPQIAEFEYTKNYAIPEYKIAVGDSVADNRMGLGTCLQIKDKYNLFPVYSTSSDNNNKIKLYRVSLLNTTRNIYMSNNKTLIKLTDVYYPNNKNSTTGTIKYGLPGHITYDGVIVYENAGFNFNEADNKVRQFNWNDEYFKSSVARENPHTFQNDIPFLAYLQFPIYSDIFFESKCYKNDPKAIVYFVSHDEKDSTKNKYWSGSIVTPANSIDLFENKQGSSDMFTPKSYTNYREDLVSVEEFNKTIRRSNVIQDESRVNGWRTFPIEGYKNITENKGNITNLIGIGTMLLAHTEHSLFMFDTSNMLQTRDKDIQLAQPDAFEVDYKEVFTSDLGFGGLQDNNSWVIDQFGYIFYNNDTNRFYRFDAGQLSYIDDDIIEWLNKYKPNNVKFANDKINNRLIINMQYLIDIVSYNITLSYNYKSKCFVSFHSYKFNEAYNTKNKLYFICNNHTNYSLYSFTNKSYCNFDNSIDKTNTIYPSKISILINSDYEAIKYINYITYKLNKYTGRIGDFTKSPVEERRNPFSGNILSVYNDLVNTGDLDITIDTENSKNVFARYDKPFWELGNWNFSYLRNNSTANISAFEKSRIFGNYFVVEFTFNNKDGLKVDFESLNYNVSK